MPAEDTRPAFDSSAIRTILKKAQPQLVDALAQCKEREAALQSSIPACITAVSMPAS